LRRVDGFRPGGQLPIDRGQTGAVLFSGQQFRLERLQPRGQGYPTLPDLLETGQPERRILREPLGIVDILSAGHPAVNGVAQQVR
jgi:hypothetical protein